MKKVLTTLTFLTVIATPAFAQSFDPDLGTGTIAPLVYQGGQSAYAPPLVTYEGGQSAYAPALVTYQGGQSAYAQAFGSYEGGYGYTHPVRRMRFSTYKSDQKSKTIHRYHSND